MPHKKNNPKTKNRKHHSDSSNQSSTLRYILRIFLLNAIIIAIIFLIIWTQSINSPTINSPTITPSVTYDESITESEKSFLESVISENSYSPQENIKISATTDLSLELTKSSLLFDVLVPVADFYYPASNISSDSLEDDLEENPDVSLISIHNLIPQSKLLSLDGHYYLDEFTSGAQFRILHFDPAPQDFLELISHNIIPFPTPDTTLSFAQTGVSAPSRNMTSKLAQVGNASYFTEYISDFLSQKDLAHTSSESSLSNYATIDNICSKPKMIDLYTSAGFDIIELTGNHNRDCGYEDAISTIDTYESLGIKIFGGGRNAEEAAIPLEISQKSTNITLLGYNFSTGGYTLNNAPGANYYTEEKARNDIAKAKQSGNFVIVDVQYNECNEYDYAYENTRCDDPDNVRGQKELFRSLIDLGADIVVGTAAHQPQTYELYENGAIYYGLGNIFFDQYWWPGTTRSLILTHYFIDGSHVQTRITPTVYDRNFQPKLMDEETSQWFIDRLNSAR